MGVCALQHVRQIARSLHNPSTCMTACQWPPHSLTTLSAHASLLQLHRLINSHTSSLLYQPSPDPSFLAASCHSPSLGATPLLLTVPFLSPNSHSHFPGNVSSTITPSTSRKPVPNPVWVDGVLRSMLQIVNSLSYNEILDTVFPHPNSTQK